jgi:hypothetical protein
MTTYRAGQRIRVEWPQNVAIEATVEEWNGHPRITVPGWGAMRLSAAAWASAAAHSSSGTHGGSQAQ